MKTAGHWVRSAKSTKQLHCLSIFMAGALALTFVFHTANVANASDVAQIEAMSTGSTVTLNNAVITEVLSNPNIMSNGVTSLYWEFLVNDGSPTGGDPTVNYSFGNTGGSIEVYATKAKGNSIFGANTPTVGDNITIANATWSPYDSIPELGVSGATYTRNSQNGGYVPPAAVPVTLDQVAALTPQGSGLDFRTLGYYVTVSNVLIRNPTPTLSAPDGSNEWDYGPVGGTVALGSTYDTTATLTPGPGNTSTNTVRAFDFENDFQGVIANLGGQVIPTSPVDITGIVQLFNGYTPEFLPFAVTPHIFSLPFNSSYWYANHPTAGGSGTWDNSTSKWNTASDGSGTQAPYSSSNFAVFGGTQPTSNVQIAHGGVTANGIDIQSNGYTISGADATATLTIGSTNTIDAVNLSNPTAVITATVTAQLVGTNGVNFNGGFYSPGYFKLQPTAGSEGFTGGDITLSAGTVEVSTLSVLGSGFSKLWFDGGGLKITTAGSYTLAATHGVRGTSASTLDLPTGSTFTIAGVTSDDAVGTNAPAIVMPNAITLDLTDNGSSTFNENILHGVTFGAAAGGGTVDTTTGTGTLGIHYIVSNNTSGVNTINGNVDFGAYSGTGGDIIMSSNSSSTAELVITGNVLAASQELYITGSGIVDMQGASNAMGSIGTTAAVSMGNTNAAGPTVYVHNSNTIGYGTGVLGVTERYNQKLWMNRS